MSDRRSLLVLAVLLAACGTPPDPPDLPPAEMREFRDVAFRYLELDAIGHEPGVSRRDPSDVIRVGDSYYVYYTRILGRPSGYWGTIWYATSTDEGLTWTERGEALRTGAPGTFDSHAVFTPNVLRHDDRYWLFYTGVQPTPGRDDGVFENNATTDYTAIGVAVADRPDGPFVRISNEPMLATSEDPDAFDSYRVDDASLLVRDGRVWLYYKGRCLAHGRGGPGRTRMGVAIAEQVEGPYRKQNAGRPVLDGSHEVLIWPHRRGVAALASIASTIVYAGDGLDFAGSGLSATVADRPQAPGAFRPDLTEAVAYGRGIRWGISMRDPGGEPYLVRFAVDLEPRE